MCIIYNTIAVPNCQHLIKIGTGVGI